MARATVGIGSNGDECDLTICSPEGDENEAKSLTIVGLGNMAALRELLTEAITDYELQFRLAGPQNLDPDD